MAVYFGIKQRGAFEPIRMPRALNPFFNSSFFLLLSLLPEIPLLHKQQLAVGGELPGFHAQEVHPRGHLLVLVIFAFPA